MIEAQSRIRWNPVEWFGAAMDGIKMTACVDADWRRDRIGGSCGMDRGNCFANALADSAFETIRAKRSWMTG
jgi:hypothetical protein